MTAWVDNDVRVELLPKSSWRWWFLDWGTLERPHRIPRLAWFQQTRRSWGTVYRFGPVQIVQLAPCSCGGES